MYIVQQALAVHRYASLWNAHLKNNGNNFTHISASFKIKPHNIMIEKTPFFQTIFYSSLWARRFFFHFVISTKLATKLFLFLFFFAVLSFAKSSKHCVCRDVSHKIGNVMKVSMRLSSIIIFWHTNTTFDSYENQPTNKLRWKSLIFSPFEFIPFPYSINFPCFTKSKKYDCDFWLQTKSRLIGISVERRKPPYSVRLFILTTK